MWSSTTKDDIYIDDDDLEGSGLHREIKDDLESSGSGFGPDDEDGDGGSGTVFNVLFICRMSILVYVSVRVEGTRF